MFNSWIGKIACGKKWQPTQYSCLGNPMDRGARWAIFHGVTQSQTMIQQINSNNNNRFLELATVDSIASTPGCSRKSSTRNFALYLTNRIIDFPSTFVCVDTVVLTWGLYSLVGYILQSLEAFPALVTWAGGLCLAPSGQRPVALVQLLSHPCNPMDCGPPGSSVHGLSQARILGGLLFSSPVEAKGATTK